MALPILRWQSLVDSRDPKFMVKGTRLAQAVYGHLSRFAIVELRTFDADGHSSVCYALADAHSVSDAEVKAGIMPRLTSHRFDGIDEAVAAIDRWTETLPPLEGDEDDEDIDESEEDE